jgi:hypothetical protein
MLPRDFGGEWHARVIKPRLPWGAEQPRAAEVGEALCAVMLSREYALEDAEYQKIVPNEFVIELHEANYQRNFQPIAERVLQQWRTLMLEQLATANSRQGRSLYQLGAPLHLELQPAADLKPTELRILCRVQYLTNPSSGSEQERTSTHAGAAALPFLEMIPGGKRWVLRSDTITIGRDERCTIHLDMHDIQDKRLISGEHAHLRFELGRYLIYDGSPDGKASVNGTFVNRLPVPHGGQLLQDGDEIILASLDPRNPRPDAPGVVALRYREAAS